MVIWNNTGKSIYRKTFVIEFKFCRAEWDNKSTNYKKYIDANSASSRLDPGHLRKITDKFQMSPHDKQRGNRPQTLDTFKSHRSPNNNLVKEHKHLTVPQLSLQCTERSRLCKNPSL